MAKIVLKIIRNDERSRFTIRVENHDTSPIEYASLEVTYREVEKHPNNVIARKLMWLQNYWNRNRRPPIIIDQNDAGKWYVREATRMVDV